MMNYGQTRASAISVRDLAVRRGGRVVVPALSVDVPAGQVVGLLGPSGCGKSTLMRSIVGVQRIAGGTVTVLGIPAGSAALRRRVGYVTQAPSIYMDLNARENLRYFATASGLNRRDAKAAVERVLALVDLNAVAGVRASNLSGGEQRRVSLGAALLGSPEVLVLDEPTVGLDPVLRQSLWSMFRGLADAGATLLVSSHVMDEASRCDRLLLMRDGRLLADDTLTGILAHTGARDAEGAFLSLVEARAQGAAR